MSGGFFETLAYYFQAGILTAPLIVSVLISLCSSLFGVTLVLKRLSFIGDGLSHVAFGAFTIATVIGLKDNEMVLTLPVTVICAILLLRKGTNAKIKGDASIAMISVGSLGFGYLVMNLAPRLIPGHTSSNVSGDVCTVLFGSTRLLSLKMNDALLMVVMSILVIIAFLLLYNRLFAVTFDEQFSRAGGIRTGIYNLLTAAIIAVIIVLAMKLVGSLLISALVVFPALSAMRLFKSFRSVIICSAVFSVICTTLGFLLSAGLDSLPGPLIVAVNLLGFGAFSLIRLIKSKV